MNFVKKKKISAVFITANSMRHYYAFQKFSKIFYKNIHITISRKKMSNKKNISKIYKNHLKLMEDKEKEILKLNSYKNYSRETYSFNKIDLFQGKLYKLLKKINPDVIITYGCPFLEEKIYKLAKKYYLNIHGGLSPWYKGSITNFWPTFFLKPANTGFTLHEISKNINSGNIFFQTNLNPNINHGIIENNIYALIKFCKVVPKKLKKIIYSNKRYQGLKQKSYGKIWTKNDFSEHLLYVVYKYYGDKINYFVQKNKIKYKKLKLYNIF